MKPPIIAKQDCLSKALDILFFIPVFLLYKVEEWAWRHYTCWIGRKYWKEHNGKRD